MSTATTSTTSDPARRDGRRVVHVTFEMRQALKVAAAKEAMTMEQLLHRILCRKLGRRDLLDRPPGIKGETRTEGTESTPTEAAAAE